MRRVAVFHSTPFGRGVFRFRLAGRLSPAIQPYMHKKLTNADIASATTADNPTGGGGGASLKERCQSTGDGYYTLDTGNQIPVRLFLTPKLQAQTDELLYSQIKYAAHLPGVLEVAITPDTHVGMGVPVGCVIATDGTLLPAPVGMDIGCGILCFKSEVPESKGRDPKLRRKFSDEVMKRIGVGMGVDGSHSLSRKEFQNVFRQGARALGYEGRYCERDFLPVDDDWEPPYKAIIKGMEQLGSLGGGNHFAELQTDQNGKLWVMLHTGSRGFGYQLAHLYGQKAREEQQKRGVKAYLEGAYFAPDSPNWSGYKNAVSAGANFAIANRLVLFEQISRAFRRVFGGEGELVYEISHNLAQPETLPDGRQAWVHRKGATRAFPAGHAALAGTHWFDTGHPVLIPGSMGDQSYLLEPQAGAANSLWSVNHGCGRRMGRSEARQKLSQSQVNRDMKSRDVLVNGGQGDVPIDEAPDVYKPSRDVIAAVVAANLARVVTELTPLATIKGTE